MKKIISILCSLCLICSMVPGMFAAEIKDPPVDDMALLERIGLSGNYLSFAAKAAQTSNDHAMYWMENKTFRNNGEKKSGVSKYVYEYLVSLGAIKDGEELTREEADTILTYISQRLGDFSRNPKDYCNKYREYLESDTAMAGSLFGASSTMQAGPMVISAAGGLVLGMALMALIQKKKAVKA